MGSPERRAALPGWHTAQVGLARFRLFLAAAPLPLQALLVLAACIVALPAAFFLIIAALIYAPYALWSGTSSVAGTVAVAVWGLAATSGTLDGRGLPGLPRYLLVLLVLVTAALSHVGQLGRHRIPCRTTAWALAWGLLFGITLTRSLRGEPYDGVIAGWLLALIVLSWRLAKALQEGRERARLTAPSGALAAPSVGTASPPPPRPPSPAIQNSAGQGAGGQGAGDSQSGSTKGGSARAGAAQNGQTGAGQRLIRAAQAGNGLRGQGQGGRAATGASAADGMGDGSDWPQITVEDAMAELDAMIGLAAVKSQVASITASVEAARRRAVAGHSAEKPMQHFVFLGPPGTGKTAVARIVAKIFYAFGLLGSPNLVEAQRADLVGEYLGATAIKTNELIDSAMGSVLFVDEAYSLVNEGDGQGDRFGSEAVQALLKRAEDDREDLIIILAGYERQMESFLSSNPGLNSRFGIRIKFPTYSPEELLALADLAIQRKGELLDPNARPVLRRMFEEIGRRRLADELGNGRFVRSLLARAGQQRDVRVMAGPDEPTAAQLVTVRGEDLELAYAELTTRFRGYTDTPTVEDALAELDALVGLQPVKRQVHEIVAQLQVARLRDRQGLASQPPSRHFVFTGPPGTGKTTVARILGRIFAALGLLVRPEVIEAHRADLVGEHLGSTAIKTNKLIDSAMGGVLFIDEAYALHNEAYSGGDAFGSEAVATLLKRAEDERERLVIVLAGYTADMDRLLRSNPGLASRFSTKISFPSYDAAQLARIAQVIAAQAGDSFDAAALPVLDSIFEEATEQGRIDALGNGRFARSLYERACASRDVRVSQQGDTATAAALTTVLAEDLQSAYRELAG
ncbi:MAG TPA: AAA family ATPase [Streptosporangiaceae bacterium]